MSAVANTRRRSRPSDLAAFVAIQVTGLIMIVVGHQSPRDFTAEIAALGTFYAVWQGNRD